MISRIRIGRSVALLVVMVALILPLAVPVIAHSASYCGHSSVTHSHAGTTYRHVFVNHFGANPHEHEKDHYLIDLGQQIYLHTRTRAC